jgi:hypothetical protein
VSILMKERRVLGDDDKVTELGQLIKSYRTSAGSPAAIAI